MRRTRTSGAGVEYESAFERDRAVENSYQPSRVFVAQCGGTIPNLWEAVVTHVVELAALVAEEEGGGRPLEAVDAFCLRHLGRQLEPALRGMLAFHVAHPTSNPARPFASWPEANTWLNAAEEVLAAGPRAGGIALCEEIARRAGWKRPMPRRRMPTAPNTERRANELRAQVST